MELKPMETYPEPRYPTKAKLRHALSGKAGLAVGLTLASTLALGGCSTLLGYSIGVISGEDGPTEIVITPPEPTEYVIEGDIAVPTAPPTDFITGGVPVLEPVEDVRVTDGYAPAPTDCPTTEPQP